MQHISNLVTSTNSQVTSMNLKEPERLGDGRVKRVFALMQANYGARWKDQTGSGNALKLSMTVWSEKLAGLSDEQVKHGLHNLPEDFCPTPARFKSICIAEQKGLTHNTPAYRTFDKSRAIEKKADPEIARLALLEIRGMRQEVVVNHG